MVYKLALSDCGSIFVNNVFASEGKRGLYDGVNRQIGPKRDHRMAKRNSRYIVVRTVVIYRTALIQMPLPNRPYALAVFTIRRMMTKVSASAAGMAVHRPTMPIALGNTMKPNTAKTMPRSMVNTIARLALVMLW